jgi:signal transduction histidine kinase
VMGLLTVERLEPSWSDWEQSQLEKIAQTIAISCLVDQQNQWLLHDQAQRNEADVLSRPKREALDNLFHQLKSPVTAIRTFGKLLLKRLHAQDENRTIADRVIHETDHLHDLLQQVQQLLQSPYEQPALPSAPDHSIPLLPSQTSSSVFPANPLSGELSLEPCLIPDLLALPLASAAAIAQEQQRHLQVELIEPLPPVMADPKALREVVTNLVDNALKYTPQHGQISICVFADRQGHYAPHGGEPGVAIAISDTGPGIPLADQPQLFQRHYRGQQAQGNIPGTGLGLAIAQDLMVKMGGQVKFWSPAHPDFHVPIYSECSGSTFLIWTPLAQNGTIV